MSKLRHDAHVVLDQHDGPPFRDLAAELDGAVDVLPPHAARGLVEQQDLGVLGEGNADFQVPLLPMREIRRPHLLLTLEMDLLQDLAGAGVELVEDGMALPEPGGMGRRRLQGDDDVLQHGEAFEDAGNLEGARESLADDLVRRKAGDGLAE